MGVYQRFEKHDLLEAYVHVRPQLEFASGTIGQSGSSNGWRGNVGVSSSLSLYDGIRARTDVRQVDFASSGLSIYPIDPVDTHSIDKVIFVSGSYPSTGSVSFVKCRNSGALDNQLITDQDWYDEHFAPIELLYDYYNQYDPDYTTGSYDYYCLHLRPLSGNSFKPMVDFSMQGLSSVTASMTCEAYVKLVDIRSGTIGSDYHVIHAQNQRWRFFVSSSGKLGFSNLISTATSSLTVSTGSWHQLAAVISGTSCAFYIDGAAAGTGTIAGGITSVANALAFAFHSVSLTVGAEYDNSGVTNSTQHGLNGFIFESRIWNTSRTLSQMSATYNGTIFNSGSDSNLVHYARFNDGPLSIDHGKTIGSGAFDYSSPGKHGTFLNINPDPFFTSGPLWHPNDNQNFVTRKNLRADRRLNMARVVHIPSMFYGKSIATGSVRLQCNAYSGQGIRRVLVDDGFGGLYMSGSCTRDLSGESYGGPRWNKVGNVFYTEGLIVIRDPALLDFGDKYPNDVNPGEDLLQVSFAGTDRISTKVFMCRANQAELNASNNTTSYVWDGNGTIDKRDDIARPVREDGTTFITSIGIYDNERRLVAVAKLAQPIRKRMKDKILIRLRLDI